MTLTRTQGKDVKWCQTLISERVFQDQVKHPNIDASRQHLFKICTLKLSAMKIELEDYP